MNFREASDRLCVPVAQLELAKQIGVSLQAIRQARAEPSSKSFRLAPPHWREGIIRLAEQRIMHYRLLINELKDDL